MMAYEAVAVMDHNGSLPNYLVANKSVQYSTVDCFKQSRFIANLSLKGVSSSKISF